jgi:hypothetical protein
VLRFIDAAVDGELHICSDRVVGQPGRHESGRETLIGMPSKIGEKLGEIGFEG